MRLTIYILSITVFIAGAILAGCNLSGQSESKLPPTSQEWNTFKSESEIKIRNNENNLAELKVNVKNKTFDEFAEKWISSMEQKNKDLKVKIELYQSNQNDWKSFQNQFDQELNELGAAIKDSTIKYSK